MAENVEKAIPSKKSARSPLLRRILIPVSILALVALLLALNYFIYLPNQQRLYEEKAFRILREEADDFKNRVMELGEFYSRGLDTANTDTEAIASSVAIVCDTCAGAFKERLDNSFTGFKPTGTQGKYELRIRDDSTGPLALKYEIKNQNRFGKTASKPIGEIWDSIPKRHQDMFEHTMLVKKPPNAAQGILLYKSPQLAVESSIGSDTLWQNRKGPLFAAIKDFTIKGAAYKLFILPFKLDREFWADRDELLLIGLISEREYRAKVANYSYPTFLMIASLLIVLIITLPLLKIFLLSRNERITATDIRALIAVMIAAPFLIVLSGSTIRIYLYADQKTDELLDSLHCEVTRNFTAEIETALRQLRAYDTLCLNPGLSAAYQRRIMLSRAAVSGAAVQRRIDSSDFKDLFFYPEHYMNLEDVFWVNNEGKQVAKWSFRRDRRLAYLDLGERSYFKNVRDGHTYHLPATSDAFCIEPTISWASGAYTINVVKSSELQFKNGDSNKAIMIGLSANMYSVCNPVVSKGFDFCIINEKGAVLFHSQTGRSLHENLFNECNQNYVLQQAVANKDSLVIPSITLYDRKVKMLIKPMKGMPFYLVTYFSKREQHLFVFHIAAFTLLCTSLLLLFLLLFLLFYKALSHKSSELYFSAYDSAWMKPAQSKVPLYQQLFSFQLFIVLVLLLLLLLTPEAQKDWFMLQAGMLLPFLVICSYYIIKQKQGHVPKYSSAAQRQNIGIAYGVLLIVFLLSWHALFYDRESGPHGQTDLMLLILAVGIPLAAPYSFLLLSLARWLASLLNPAFERFPSDFRNKLKSYFAFHYLRHYANVVMLSILLISVVPTLAFLRYAVKQEIRMQARSRQFYTAQNIERRRADIDAVVNLTKLKPASDLLRKEAATSILQHKFSTSNGIYLLGGNMPEAERIQPLKEDSVLSKLKYTPKDSLRSGSSYFYQLITQFLFLPDDHADFFNNNPPFYFWRPDSAKKKIASLLYFNTTDHQTKHAVQINGALKPPEFSDVFKNTPVQMLLLGLLLLLAFHYEFVFSLAKRIFLIGYFESGAAGRADVTWINAIYGTVSVKPDDQLFFGATKVSYTRIHEKEKTLEKRTNPNLTYNEAAEGILRIQHLLTPAYDVIWKQCATQEQFILYDFALDGFTNYKNADILFRLFRKGLVRKDDDNQLVLMSHSFRNHLLTKADTGEINELKRQIDVGSTWKNVRYILFILFFAVVLFLFATQQEITNKLLVIVPGLVTLVPALLKLFDRNLIEKTSSEKS